MKTYFKYSLIALVVIIIVFFAFKFFNSEEKTTIALQTSKVENGSLSISVTATGNVEPVDTVEVGTQVSGLVQKVYATYNSTVKKGDLIAELDKTNLNESVNNAQAAYQAALNQLNYNKQNHTRQKNMYESGVISKADYEQAVYEMKNAETQVSQSKTSLVQAQTNLSYANIYSPIDGVILNKYVEEGQTVAASMSTPTLFTIAKDINQMQVEADVDEADIGNVAEGQRVAFTVDAFPDEEFSGRVKQVRLGAKTTSNVVTYTVLIDADNPDKKLKPGLTATITIYTTELEGVPTIDAQALNLTLDITQILDYYAGQGITAAVPAIAVSSKTNRLVWVKNADGTLQQKSITTGTNDGLKVQVLDGLTSSDDVVLKIEEISLKQAKAEGQSSGSPFMPKPPSRNNKKSSQQ